VYAAPAPWRECPGRDVTNGRWCGRCRLVAESPRDEQLSQSEQQVAPLRDLVAVSAQKCSFCQWNQELALLRRLYAHCGGVGPCANSRDDALARPGCGRGERGRGSSRGSPDERASGPGIRLSSPPCTEAVSSSADDADYADRGGITFGSTCTCGAVPEPCLPLLRGEASSTNGGVPALDCRTRDPVVLVVSAAQLSAPHHAECPRSDRWILAKTKSLPTRTVDQSGCRVKQRI